MGTVRMFRSSTSGSAGLTFASMYDEKLSWLSMTPLGRPVVPAVYRTIVRSPPSASGKRSSGSEEAIRSSYRRQPSTGCSRATKLSSPAKPSPADLTSPAYRAPAMRTLGDDSATMWASSSARTRKFRGT